MSQGLIRNKETFGLYNARIKILISLLFIIMAIVGCKQKEGGDIIKTAAIHYAGVFITKNIHSVNALRIKGKVDVKTESDSTYLISGSVEEFSPMNYPISVERFNEKLWYSGSDPNKPENWKCIEIYIGNKKMK